MTGWIVGISGNYEQHWGIAEREGLWDTLKEYPIRRGDLLHFWLTGKNKRLLGCAEADSRMYALGPESSRPWDDDPSKRTYTFRVDLLNFQHMVADSPDIDALRTIIGRRDDARNWPAPILRGDGGERLTSLYGGGSAVEDRLADAWVDALLQDERIRDAVG